MSDVFTFFLNWFVLRDEQQAKQGTCPFIHQIFTVELLSMYQHARACHDFHHLQVERLHEAVMVNTTPTIDPFVYFGKNCGLTKLNLVYCQSCMDLNQHQCSQMHW